MGCARLCHEGFEMSKATGKVSSFLLAEDDQESIKRLRRSLVDHLLRNQNFYEVLKNFPVKDCSRYLERQESKATRL